MAAVQTNPRLEDALRDAQLMLAYAAQSGRDVDKEIVRTIVATGHVVGDRAVTDKQEEAFWDAWKRLAKAVSPVSVSSLRATLDSVSPPGRKILGFFQTRPRSHARRAVFWYTTVAVITLLTLLLLQVYWLFGTSITGEIQKAKKDIATLEQKIRERGKTVQAAPERPAPTAPAAGKDVAGEDADVTAWKAEIANLRLQKNSSLEMLREWSTYWEHPVGGPSAAAKPPAGKAAAEAHIARLQSAFVVLDVLQKYALPLLYGLLGSTVYVLRTLTGEIKARTYSEASNISFRIRLYLGTLGGLVVAWFVAPDADTGAFKAIPPLALAFLAGYSVELVFTAMDRIIEAFTGRREEASRERSPRGQS